MAVVINASTIPGGFTPACSNCGIALCWDISDEEYYEAKEFWDAWRCEYCDEDAPGSLKRWKQDHSTIDVPIDW